MLRFNVCRRGSPISGLFSHLTAVQQRFHDQKLLAAVCGDGRLGSRVAGKVGTAINRRPAEGCSQWRNFGLNRNFRL
jgi:hypothetical protein